MIADSNLVEDLFENLFFDEKMKILQYLPDYMVKHTRLSGNEGKNIIVPVSEEWQFILCI